MRYMEFRYKNNYYKIIINILNIINIIGIIIYQMLYDDYPFRAKCIPELIEK